MFGLNNSSELSVKTGEQTAHSPEKLLEQMALQDVTSQATVSHATEVDKLGRILKEGLLSRRFSKRAGLPLEEDYGFADEYFVHLGGGKKSAFYGYYSPALLAKHWSRVSTSNPADIVSIILAPDIEVHTFWPPYESTREMGKPSRIAPRLFAGIIVSGQPDKDEVYKIPQYPGLDDKEWKTAIEKANLVAQETLSRNPKLEEQSTARVLRIQTETGCKPLPVYNYKGDLLWPVKLTHDQVMQRISSTKT